MPASHRNRAMASSAASPEKRRDMAVPARPAVIRGAVGGDPAGAHAEHVTLLQRDALPAGHQAQLGGVDQRSPAVASKVRSIRVVAGHVQQHAAPDDAVAGPVLDAQPVVLGRVRGDAAVEAERSRQRIVAQPVPPGRPRR